MDIDRLIKKLRKMKKETDSERVILFGSCARGDVNECSDVDVFVVKDTDERYIDRMDEFLDYFDISTDVFVYTPEEFKKRKDSPFIRNVLEEGVEIG